jgi:PTS system N-acetylgalactosamine-specific IIC component
MGLVCLIVFLIALDGGIGSRFLHEPLVSCTLIGLVMGDAAAGLSIGAMAEMISLMMDDDGGLGIFAACVVPATINGGITSYSEEMLLPLIGVSAGLACLFEAVMTLFVPLARKGAEKRNTGTLGAAAFIPLLLRSVLAAVLAGYAYSHAATIADTIQTAYNSQQWLFNAMRLLAVFLPFVGLAVVLRNLSLKDHYGALLAGFATALLAGQYSTWALFACVLIGFGICAYTFHQHQTPKESGGNQTEKTVKKGSAEKWW